ncbi:hypothetical protein CDD82_6244 [Ophiocordyceps australis]|uniref:AA1-like domain-containing protein n=1 Tax=Ophiocordyceps australis TaxID=1399860 RepID=A0A2C5YX82_9HYPO|nr:hypothetical protein CDD82_6244 [Ophiocordyceps australis]
MRVLVLGSLVALATATLPAQSQQREEIKIADFYVRQDVFNGAKVVHAVGFKLAGRDTTDLACYTTEPVFPNPTEAGTCGDSTYRFTLHQGTDAAEFALRIYHQVDPSIGLWGQGNVPSVCHAGGAGPDDFVCNQVGGPVSIFIDNTRPRVDS